jgi:hypothetical protein
MSRLMTARPTISSQPSNSAVSTRLAQREATYRSYEPRTRPRGISDVAKFRSLKMC